MKFGLRKIINNSSHDHERYYLLSQAVMKEDKILSKLFDPSELHYLMLDLCHTLFHMVRFKLDRAIMYNNTRFMNDTKFRSMEVLSGKSLSDLSIYKPERIQLALESRRAGNETIFEKSDI
jgi:hypothetical protein